VTGRAKWAIPAIAAVLACALGAAVVVFVAGVQTRSRSGVGTSFVTQKLGAAHSSAARAWKPRKEIAVSIEDGYTIRRGRSAVALTSTAGGRRWSAFAHGTQRPTSFGFETITVDSATTEDFLTVNRRQGVRTWRWQLDARNVEPRLGADGGIGFVGGNIASQLRIPPVKIQDGAGADITPSGSRWSLIRKHGAWSLELRLDDSHLPLPYVIDPATDYGPTTVYLTNALSGTYGSADRLLTATGGSATECTVAVDCPGANDATSQTGTEYQDLFPNSVSTAYPTTPSVPTTSTAPKGWLVETGGAAGTGTLIPTGSWTFKYDTSASVSTNNASVAYRIGVGMWLITVSGNSITSVDGTLIDPGSASSYDTANPFPGNTSVVNHTLTLTSVPQVSLSANQRLLVRFYARKVTATNAKETGIVYLRPFTVATDTANGGSSPTTNQIVHPSASDTTAPSTPTLSSISPGSSSRTNSTTPTFTAGPYSDPDGDSGHIHFQVCSDSACNTLLANGAFDSSTVSSGAGSAAGTPSVALSLSNGTTYYWRAQSVDSNGAASSYTATSSFVYDSTVPTFSSAQTAIDGTTVTLTYSESLNATNEPDGSAYDVRVNGTSDPVSSTSVSGTQVTLTLQNTLHSSDTVTVAYTSANATANGGQTVQDLASNAAADFTAAAVTNATTGLALTYPLTTYLMATFNSGTFTNTDKIQTTAPGTTPCVTCPAMTDGTVVTGAGTYYAEFVPNSTVAVNANGGAAPAWSTTVAAPTATQAGWLVLNTNGSGNSTVLPAATWTLSVPVLSSGTSSVTNYLAFGIYKVTDNGSGQFDTTKTVTLLDPTAAGAADTAHNLTAATTGITASIAWSAPKIQLDANQHILVRIFTRLVTTGSQRTSRTVTLSIGQNASSIVRSSGAALDTFTPTTPSLTSVGGAPGQTAFTHLQQPTFTTGAFSDSDGADTGQIFFKVCSDSACSTVLSNGSFNSSSGLANGSGAPTGSPGASLGMTNGQQYYWAAYAEDNHGADSPLATPVQFTYDATAPTVSSRTISGSGTTLNVLYGESLDTGTNPDPSAYSVSVNGAGDSVTATSVSGSTVALTLQNAVHAGDTVTVAYTSANATASGGQTVQDPAGNAAADFGASAVTNTVTNIAPDLPTLVTPASNGYVNTLQPTLTAHFSDPDTQQKGTINFELCTAPVAASSATACNGTTVKSGTALFSSAQASTVGAQDLAAAVPSGYITGDGTYYWQAQNKDDGTGTLTSSWSATRAVMVDTTKPVYASSATNTAGTQITLTFTETGSGLNTSATTPASAFTVLVNGGSRSVSSVSTTDANHVVLTLASRVYGEDSITVAYSTSGLTGLQPLQDVAGNTVNTLTAQSVTNTAPGDTTTSTLVASPTTIYADSSGGATSSTITVTLKNSGSTNLGTSGGTVALATDLGSLSGVTNAGNGTYTATLTSTTTGIAHVTGTLDGRTFAATADVTVSPGLLDHFAVTNTGGGSISTQTAGTAFNVKITAQDLNNNTVTSFTGAGNTVTVSSNRVCSSGCTTTPTFTNGVLASRSVTLTQAGASSTITATRTSGGSQAGTSSAFTVNAGSFAKLQLLLPGESAAAGTTTGKTGTPDQQTAGAAFNVTVNAVDANWNPVSSTDTVHLTSTDTHATLASDTALVAGSKQLSVTLKTAGAQTISASDTSDVSKSADTSTSVTVNAGSFTKLQLLLPGETADPGSASGKSGTPTARTAGTSFNATVNAVDANWNPVSSTDTVRLSSSDGYAVLPADTALVGGTKQLSVTLKTAAAQTLTAADQTNGAITSNTSASVTVNAGSFTKLQILLPGESADPGSTTGKSGSPTARTAGSAFNVTVNAVDANWNLVSSTDTVHLSSTDTHATLPADTALVGGTKQLSVTAKTAGSWTFTAADQTNGAISSNTSASVTVNVGSFAKLQVLLPGETADPGATSGKTGTPDQQTAGAAFNVTVNAVDANWNPVSSTDTVHLTSTDTHATLAGDTALVAGSKQLSVTLKTAGAHTISASDTSDVSKSADTSASVTVNAGSFTKLQILLPGETADPGSATGKSGTPTTRTAGSSFNVTVNAVDANWNPVSSTDTVHLSSTDTHATLASDAALVGGTKQLSVTAKTAGSWTFSAADQTNGGITSNTSASVTVNAGSFTKLQILLPGETADPGSPSGKSGTPSDRTAGSSFNVTVNAVDANWNPVSSTDTVHLSSTDTHATLAGDTALVGGTKQLSVTLKTAAAQTLTVADQTNGAITSNTSASVTVNAGSFTKLQILLPGESADPGSASGKSGTPTARTAGSSFNATVNAVDANWNPVSSTDTVHLESSDAGSTLPADTALVGGTKQLAVTLKTAGTQTITATDQTNGGITADQSSDVSVDPGAFTKLQVLLPGESADPGSASGKSGTPTARTAGAAFNVTVNAVDANWNPVSSTDTVHLTSTDTHTALPADTGLVGGTKQLSVTAKTAGSWTFTAADQSDGAITSNTSSSVTVNAGTFTKLQVLLAGETADPGTATGKSGTPTARTAGTAFNITVNAVDTNWNPVSSADTVHLDSTDIHTSLPADTALVGGTKQLSVTFKTAGSWTITAGDQTNGSIASGTSAAVATNAGAFTKLQILLPGETADPGAAAGKSGTPSNRTAGSAFNVTVNAVDANWNLVDTVTDTAHVTSSDANAVLPTDTALVDGTKQLPVTLKTAGTRSLTASDVTDAGKTSNQSANVTVNPGALNKLQILLPGESADPGSATGKTGSPTTRTAGTAFNVTVNAVDANWNLVAATHSVRLTSSDPAATLPADAALVAGTKQLSVTLKTAGSQTVTASDQTDGAVTSAQSANATVNSSYATKLVLSGSGTQVAGGAQTITITAKDQFGNTATDYTGNHAITFSGAADAPSGVHPTVTDRTGAPVDFGSATSLTFSSGVANTTGRSLTLYKVGSANIAGTVGDGGNDNSTTITAAGGDRLTVSVSAAAASQLHVLSVNGGSTVTATIGFSVDLQSEDQYGNASVPSQTTAVTLSGKSGCTCTGSIGGTVSGNLTTSSASLTISGVTWDTQESGVVLTASATSGDSLTADDSLPFTVTAVPTTLVITSIDPSTPTAAPGTFSITITAEDSGENVGNVSADTDVALSLDSGTGTLGGTVAGTIPAGQSSVTIDGVTYTKAESGVTITATRTSGDNLTAGTSAPFSVDPGPATHFGLSASSPQTAGVAFDLSVTALDANDNVATGYTGTLQLTTSDANATLPEYTFTNSGGSPDHGEHVFSIALSTAGDQSVTATDTDDGSIAGTQSSIEVDAAVADHFAISAEFSTRTAGETDQLTITAKDTFGNTATGYAGDMSLTFSGADPSPSPAVAPTVTDKDGDAIDFGTATTISFANGVSTAGGLMTLYAAGDAFVSVTDGSIAEETAAIVTVSEAAFDKFEVSIGTQSNNVPFVGASTITAEDVYGNTVTTFDASTDHVSLAVSPAGSLVPATLQGADFSGGVADLSALGATYTGASGTRTVTATAATGETGTSAPFTVNPGPVDHFTVAAGDGSSIGSQTAGAAFDTKITAEDVSNNTATGFTGTAVISSNRTCSAGCTTTAAFTLGVLTGHSVTLTQTGSATITATRSGGVQTGTSNAFTVDPAALDHFQVKNASGSNIGTQTAGTGFDVKVTAQDAYDNTQTSFTGTAVISSNRTCSSGCTTTAAFTGGVLSGHSLTLTEAAASGSTITATGSGKSGTSNTFTVNPAAASKLAVASVPGTDVTAGAPFTVAVESQDSFGNASAVSGDTAFQLNPSGAGTIGGNTGTITAGTSSKTLTGVTYTKSGSLTLVAHRTGGDSLTDSASSSAVTIVADAVDHFLVRDTSGNAIGTQVAGVAVAIKVTARDQFDNTATSYGGTAVISSNRACSSGCTTTASFTNGVLATHSVTLTQSGSDSTITATDSGKTGTSNTFTVGAAAASHYDVSASSPQTAGVAFNVTVTALDAFENTATGHAGTITFSSSDGTATLPGDYTFVSGDAGQKTFSVVLKRSGSQTVTVTNTASGTVNGTSAPLTVDPAAVQHFVIGAAAGGNIGTQTAGTGFNIKITAQDQFDNTATGFTGTANVTSNRTIGSGGGTTAAFTAGVLASHAITLTEAGSGSTITVTRTGGSETDSSNTFTVVPAAASTATSTIGANPASLTADGTSTSTLTIRLKDAYGNNLTSSGGTVTVSTTKGTIGAGCTSDCASTNNSNGTYTATLKASTTTGTATVSAKLNGSALANSVGVALTPGSVSLAISPVTAVPGAITADGSSTSLITVRLQDALGNDETTSQGTVAVATTRGSLSSVTDHNDGTYTATLTSSTSAGTATVTAKLNGADLTNTATVTFAPGPATKYVVTASDPSPVAGDTVTVTAQLADAHDNPVPSSGLTINWTSSGSGGSLSAPTSTTDAGGAATVTFTTDTTAGIAYTVTADDGAIQGTTAPFTSVPGAASTVTSTILVSAASIAADAVSTSTVTVELRDSNGNDLTAGGDSVTLATTLGDLSSVDDAGDGTYESTLTSGPVAGTAHVTGTLNGSPLADSADVTFTAGPAARFLVSASSSAPVAGAGVTITAQLTDVNGNLVEESGHTVTWSHTDGGSFSSPTSNTDANGVATVTYTTSATVSSARITATEGSITGTSPSIDSVPGAASLSQSTITASRSKITADGISTSTITVRLKDSNGNNLVASGGTVVVSRSGTGTLGATTNNGNGTYTATLTAPSSVGSATVGATLDGNALTATATVNFVAPDPSTSTIAASPASIVANGSSTSTITVTLKDAYGDQIVGGGATVEIAKLSGGGRLSGVTDHANGIYTATLTAPTTVGSATIGAKVNGTTITTGNRTVSFVPGVAAKYVVTSSAYTRPAGSTVTITAQLTDANGNAVASAGRTVTWSRTNGGSFSAATSTTNVGGVASVQFTVSTAAGASHAVTANDGSVSGTAPAIITTTAAVSPATSTLGCNSSQITADGSSMTLCTVQLRDVFNNVITSSQGTVTMSTTLGSLSGVTDNGDGTFTALLGSPTTAGTAVVSGVLNGSSMSHTASVEFVGTPPLLVSSTPVDGSVVPAQNDFTLTANVPVSWTNVALLRPDGSTVNLSDDGGTSYTRSVEATAAGDYVITATMSANGLSAETAVGFTVLAPPQLVTAAPDDGSTLQSVSQIALAASDLVTWRDWTVTKDGGTPTVLDDDTGVSVVRDYTATAAGLYVVRVTMDDGVNAPVTVVTHFTIPSTTQHEPPPVMKNVDPDHTTVLSTSNLPTLPGASVTVTLPALGRSEPLVLSLTPKQIPSAFGSGISFEVKVQRDDGSLITDFSDNPLEIRVDGVSSSFEPYTSSDGVTWTKIDSIPSRVLPDNLRQGMYRDGSTVYIATRHLSYFALLKPKALAPASTKLALSISASQLKRNVLTVRTKSTLPATLSGDLYSPKSRHLHAWRVKVRAGVSTLKLKWPSKARTHGVYKLVWLARANGQVVKRTITVRVR
jgi:adhesin/invasin